jgi:hypothetical protein
MSVHLICAATGGTICHRDLENPLAGGVKNVEIMLAVRLRVDAPQALLYEPATRE